MPEMFNANTQDQGRTVGNQTIMLPWAPIPNNMIALVSIRVIAVRLSNGATKAWSVEALIKKIGGNVVVAEFTPNPINVLASAADETALSGTNISLYSDAESIGINCSGQAGATIEWLVNIEGRALVA